MHMFMGTMRVARGATITVKNIDSDPHTLTELHGKFDTGEIASNGGSATFTAPSTAGSYSFYCQYHSEMTGTLVVV